MKYNKYIDHTLLRADASTKEIIKLCQEAKEYDFASVCVNPDYVKLCKNQLKNTNVKVCTVIGFPLGSNTTSIKVKETTDAIANGAQEIDMVVNIS
jgi:deoxyribose-phosphate aldolase